jgi:hypothetical protein
LARVARGSLNLKLCTKFMRAQARVVLVTSQQELALIAGMFVFLVSLHVFAE